MEDLGLCDKYDIHLCVDIDAQVAFFLMHGHVYQANSNLGLVHQGTKSGVGYKA